MFKRFSLFSIFLLIIGLIILVFGLMALGKVFFRTHEINREISRLEKEIQESEKNKKEFKQLIEYLKTDSFKEKDARLKLDLQKPGEKVVAIFSSENSDLISGEAKDKEKENSIKWWKYFFGRTK